MRKIRSLLAPVLFVSSVSASAYLVGSYSSYTRLLKSQFHLSDRLYAEDRDSQLLQSRLQKIPTHSHFLHEFYSTILKHWHSLPQSSRTLYALISVNSAVFLLWRIPALQRYMYQHFTHSPASGRYYTIVTSCFSHKHFWHFAVNQLALYSFGKVVHDLYGREHFLALYITACGNASLFSHISSRLFKKTLDMRPSLGASGGIYALFGIVAFRFPESNVSLIFLPTYPIPIGLAFPAMVGMDITGILRKWQTFDHYVNYFINSLGTCWWSIIRIWI